MRISDVTPFLLRGDEIYGAHAGDAEATDQGDYLLLVRVRTDEGLEAWADVETLGPVAVAVIAGQSMGAMGFRTLRDVLIGQDPLDIAQRWEDMYLASAYYGRRGVVIQCISAIDNCLWSMAAQHAGVTLYDLTRRTSAGSPACVCLDAVPWHPGSQRRGGRLVHFLGIQSSEVRLGWLRHRPRARP